MRLNLPKQSGTILFMLEETAKQQYLRAWEYYQQGKIADARALAYVLLKSEQFEAKWYAHVVLSHVEESAAERMQNLKPLLARDPQSAWAAQRFIQLKNELLDEAGRALQQHDYAQVKNVLQPVLEISPNDPAATALWSFAQSHVPAPPQEFAEPAAHEADAEAFEKAEPSESVATATATATILTDEFAAPSSVQTETSDSDDELLAQAPSSADEILTSDAEEAELSAEAELHSPREHVHAAQPSWVWQFPFTAESEIIATFEASVQELLARIETFSPKPENLQESLRFAERKKREAWKEGMTTNLFLKPAVLAATDFAEAFLREGHPREAFVTANVFGEMCKVLLARSPEQYRMTFERLLHVAGCALAEHAHEERQRSAALQTTSELEHVCAQLQTSCFMPALSTWFDNKTGRFVGVEYERESSEDLLHAIVAEYFFERMSRFSEEDEARAAFLRRNLPRVQSLRLSPELQTKLAPWLDTASNDNAASVAPEKEARAEEPEHITPEKNIWDSHPVTSWLTPEELREIVEEFLAAGHVRDVIAWLNERIECHPNFFANCLELARIYEEHAREIDKAFEVFHDRLMAQLSEAKDGPWVEKTAKKMLNLCKRHERVDLAQQLHAAVAQSPLDADFLAELARFAKLSGSAEEIAQPASSEFEETTTPNNEFHDAKTARASVIKTALHAAPNGRAGLFIDHENLWNGILDVNRRHRMQLPSVWWEKERWLDEILRALLLKAKNEFQRVAARVAVGYWQHRDQALFLPAYLKHKFIPLQPELVAEYEGAIKNGVDFKLADEIRRAQRQAQLAGAPLRQIIIVSGDGDFAHLAGNLVEEEVLVQVWSVTKTVNKIYLDIIGSENIAFIDDECLYRQPS